MKDGMIVDEYGNKYWYKNDLRHRIDGPAVIRSNGTKYWYFEGKLHRTDGPAIIFSDGIKEWHLNGKYLSHEEWLVILGHKKESS
jgi:hypothetical protein